MTKKKSMYMLCVVSLIALFPCNILAIDSSDVPGYMCRYYGKLSSDDFFDGWGTLQNATENTSGSVRNVTCPLIRTGDADLSSFYLELSDSDADCRLYWRNENGSSGSWPPTAVSNGVNGFYEYRWTDGPYSGKGKSISLYCKIEPEVVIDHYRFVSD